MLVTAAEWARIGQEYSRKGVRGGAVPASFVIRSLELSFWAEGLRALRHVLAADYLDAATAVMACFKCTGSHCDDGHVIGL